MDGFGRSILPGILSTRNTGSLAYKKYGEDSLKDRQGRHKKDYKPQTEEERLRLENATLKRQLYLSQMEIDVLKKLQELERGNR